MHASIIIISTNDLYIISAAFSIVANENKSNWACISIHCTENTTEKLIYNSSGYELHIWSDWKMQINKNRIRIGPWTSMSESETVQMNKRNKKVFSLISSDDIDFLTYAMPTTAQSVNEMWSKKIKNACYLLLKLNLERFIWMKKAKNISKFSLLKLELNFEHVFVKFWFIYTKKNTFCFAFVIDMNISIGWNQFRFLHKNSSAFETREIFPKLRYIHIPAASYFYRKQKFLECWNYQTKLINVQSQNITTKWNKMFNSFMIGTVKINCWNNMNASRHIQRIWNHLTILCLSNLFT